MKHIDLSVKLLLAVLAGLWAMPAFAVMAGEPPRCVEAERHGRAVCGRPATSCDQPNGAVFCNQMGSVEREYASCHELEKQGGVFLHYGACGDDPLPHVRVPVGVQMHNYRDCVRKVRRLNRVPVAIAPWKAAPGQGRPDLTPRAYCQALFPYANEVQDDDELEEEPVPANNPPAGVPVKPPPGAHVSQLE